jgi:hypothetical protein
MLTYYGWFKIYHDCPGDVLPCSCLTEEGIEGIITPTNGLITRHLTIRLDTMF